MENKREPLLNIKLIDAKSSQDLEDAFHVRREVFIKEQNVPDEEEFDRADLRSHHVIVYSNTRPVATGRLFKDGETWLIGRISVLKEYRGKLHAQTHAVSFYEKFGFVAYGKTFLETNIEHISMVKKI